MQSGNEYTAASLRKAVCNFALDRQNEDVQRLAVLHDDAATMTLRTPWDAFFTNMKRSGVFAEGPVIRCTALMLQREFAVISFGNTRDNPYLHIPSNNISEEFPLIYLGNLVNMHFQSFVPDVGGDQARLTSLRGAPADEAPLKPEAVLIFNTPKPQCTSPAGEAPLKPEAVREVREVILNTPKPQYTSSTPRPLKRAKVVPSPATMKNLKKLSEVSTMGDCVISNVRMLVRENRRLHALVRQLEFQLECRSSCNCAEADEVDVAVVVDAVEEDYFLDNDDSATDESILSTPLL